METISFEGKDYISVTDLFTHNRHLFKGCSKTGIRSIITSKAIPESEFVFVSPPCKTQPHLRLAIPSNKRALLLISSSWVEANLNVDEPQYEAAPPLILVEDHEAFRNEDGSVAVIECRGDRNQKKVWFKVKDVSRVFGMPNLTEVLLHKDRGYERGAHFQTFSRTQDSVQTRRADHWAVGHEQTTPTMFLTYKGMMKVLYSSRSGNADKFTDWATDVLFVAQMGTDNQRQEMASMIAGPTTTIVNKVMGCASSSTPCVYLFSLGSVKDLKEVPYFKDALTHHTSSSRVFKFGLTNDLKRRTGEHERSFGSLEGVTLHLTKYSYIDPQFLFKAEHDLKKHFEMIGTLLTIEGQNERVARSRELVVLDASAQKTTLDMFQDLGKRFGGILSDVVEQLNKTDLMVERLNHQLETDRLNHQLETDRLNHQLETDRLNHQLEVVNHQMTQMDLSHRLTLLTKDLNNKSHQESM